MPHIKILISKIAIAVSSVYLFLNENITGRYRFTLKDLLLYMEERFREVPLLKKEKTKGHYDKIIINSTSIYWPKAYPTGELPWLYAEIFYPWDINPSSYDHPLFQIKKSSWVMDCGACEGYYTSFALERGAKKVIAVEPIPKLADALDKTFMKYKKKGSYFTQRAVLGKKNGFAYIQVNPREISSSKITQLKQGTPVKMTTVDQIVTRAKLKDGGIVKIDVEGAEMEVLEGMKNTISRNKPRLAVAVYHGYENAQLCRNIILKHNSTYQIEYRGMYGWFGKPRPYMLFAW